MISGRGLISVQLVMAFRWMIPMCPLNGFGVEKIVSIPVPTARSTWLPRAARPRLRTRDEHSEHRPHSSDDRVRASSQLLHGAPHGAGRCAPNARLELRGIPAMESPAPQ